MTKRKVCLLLLIALAASVLAAAQQNGDGRRTPLLKRGGESPGQAVELQAPAGTRPAKIDPAGKTILPNGRIITPQGLQVKVAPHPYGLALSPDGRTLVTVNNGTAPFSFSIVTDLASGSPRVAQVPAESEARSRDADPHSVFVGAAIAPDNRTLYVSEGDNGRVGVFDLETRKRLGAISLDGEFAGKKYAHSLTGDLKLSPGGQRLYVLDIAHLRLVVIDTKSKETLASVGVGRLPFALALSPDGQRAYVANAGMFEYSVVPGYDEKHPIETALDFPAFGFPSLDATKGTVVGGKRVPGLGDPNVPESNSLWVIDVSEGTQPRVVAKIPTGIPIGAESVGGASPGAVVAGKDRVFVSNVSQDSVAVIDTSTNALVQTLALDPFSPLNVIREVTPAPPVVVPVKQLKGVLPFGLALSPDEKLLFVACAGINAVAVVNAEARKELGYIPTGWFPARVAVSPDGKALYVANAKGFGAGPNGGPGFHPGPEGTYIGEITKGTVSIIPGPASRMKREPKTLAEWDELELVVLTNSVLSNNGFFPSGNPSRRRANFPIPAPGHASEKIHHIVLIVKENRTFDQVFGDIAKANGKPVNSDASLAHFGDHATVRDDEGHVVVEGARVTPNHHALALQFGFSDNFYVDSDVSADGHNWLQGNYPNEVLESFWPAAYGDRLTFRADPETPGRFYVGAFSPTPELYDQGGTLWDHLARNRVTFRNYGEGFDVPGSNDGPPPTGGRESLNVPLPEPLFENTSRDYAKFNTSISDQYRYGQFENEFRVRYLSGKEPLPQFIYIWLPNDHTDKPRPGDGYPTRAAYVADNDLALGKLIELFSHSPFWRDTAAFVTEDDSQDGTDHVDAHRSILLILSPYARRGPCHVHSSMVSIHKTMDLVFGIPYMNQFDAAASSLADCFTHKADFKPYKALPSDTRVFDPAKIREPWLEMHADPGPHDPFDDPATIRRLHRKRAEADDD